jgi:hypothetical protein
MKPQILWRPSHLETKRVIRVSLPHGIDNGKDKCIPQYDECMAANYMKKDITLNISILFAHLDIGLVNLHQD